VKILDGKEGGRVESSEVKELSCEVVGKFRSVQFGRVIVGGMVD
jgi:hypothetical protein